MTYLDTLRELAEAAGRIKCEQEDCPYFGKTVSRGCDCYNDWETADAKYHDALDPERILQLIAVIEAAKAYFGQGDELEAEAAFHESLAALERSE